MKVLTANRLSDGRVIYVGVAGRPVSSFRQAARFAGEPADRALERRHVPGDTAAGDRGVVAVGREDRVGAELGLVTDAS